MRNSGGTSYRELQVITMLLNDSFRLYLTWFPSILLGLVALLIYGSIRLWHIELLTYINFPTCGLRCLFESMSPLSISGDVNKESGTLLEQWKRNTVEEAKRMKPNRETKWQTAFQTSCSNLKCTAGSLYTFQHSIVVTTIHNTAQLTLNLLLVYK